MLRLLFLNQLRPDPRCLDLHPHCRRSVCVYCMPFAASTSTEAGRSIYSGKNYSGIKVAFCMTGTGSQRLLFNFLVSKSVMVHFAGNWQYPGSGLFGLGRCFFHAGCNIGRVRLLWAWGSLPLPGRHVIEATLHCKDYRPIAIASPTGLTSSGQWPS